MRLVMTMKVRDEEDVLEHNLRFHHALGVDHFLITDNGSADGTLGILERWERAGLATVFHEDTADLRTHGAGWYTRMGVLAATEHEADWVFHNDADEFWWPASGTLEDVLGEIAGRYGAVVCPRTEFAGRPDGPGTFADRLVYREALSSLQPKVIHRGDPEVVVLHRGAHEVAHAPGQDAWAALRPPGRAVHRTVRSGGDDEREDIGLVWAPHWPVRIMHFPVRSFEQFRVRTEISMKAGGFREGGRFKRLAEAYEQGTLDELYEGLVSSDEALEAEVAAGRMVRDERLAELLPRCPDPLEGGEPGSVAVEWGEAEVAAELDALEYDAMRLLARTQRFQMLQIERQRERLDAAKADLDELRNAKPSRRIFGRR